MGAYHRSVVAMVPNLHVISVIGQRTLPNLDLTGRVFVMEKLGLDVMSMAGEQDDPELDNK
ncbi:hypothetical protein PHLCEN_2v2630 [Hermanssonia centrifuga]|uniref:Uncharacterized protein n=1 Tax=Hermanssonia centrifuga TaxID=98765 RepID=A0A2R6RIN4_9APHY|nr:hypothetical protein PHLCEN_2v2630 [Hermanssonia centrifuga]